MKQSTPKRRRGVILTSQGLQKIQAAKSKAEIEENFGNRYTLEDLSERTTLSVDTLMKVFACETGVDKQTLKTCFRAFNLTLEPSDYGWPKQQEQNADLPLPTEREPELPGGQVPLNSGFYVDRSLNRSTVEAECCRAIEQPGALVRIKAPRFMGKTSLIARVLDHATTQRYRSVFLSLQLADKSIFQDLDRFLRWLCTSVGLGLQLPNQLTDYWDELYGSKVSCSIYFEQYLLAKIQEPIVLGLDDIDRLFQHPELADEFFGLLRTWHEDAKNRQTWQKLRLVIAHAMEVYLPLNANKSPFNVGLPIELRSFTSQQVQDLAQRHGLTWTTAETDQLLALVGGHPYLVRLALYHICRQTVTLEQILHPDSDGEGIYKEHLQRQLWSLQQDSTLADAYAQIVKRAGTNELELIQGFKLQSMGLIHFQNNRATPSCELYTQYFRERLGTD